MATSLLIRIDNLEWDLRRLEGELHDLRREARASGVAEATEPQLFEAPPTPAPSPAPAPAPAAAPAPARPPARESRPAQGPRVARPSAPPRVAPRRERPRVDLGALLTRFDLVGAGGLAVVGGAVMALGIGLLFVLAAERGWIGPEARLVLGATVSALLVGAGVLIRARYGHLAAALAAVGAGIAGAYATLAAAAAMYDLVSDAVALPLAAAIAGVAVVVSLAWRSEMIAALGLVGAALAPALQAADAGISADGVAFAVLVLAATSAVAVARRWQLLLCSVLAVVGAQGAWLVAATQADGDVAVIAVTAALAGVALAAACAWQLVTGARALTPLTGTVSLAVVGFALLSAGALFEAGRDRGVALAIVAGAYGLAWLLLRRRQPDLALVLAGGALGIGAVAVAGLLSGDGLTLAWAAEAALFSWLAFSLHDARLRITGLAYLGLATAHLLGVTAPQDLLFDSTPVDASAAVPPLAVALAALAAGLLAPQSYRETGETGPLAFVAALRRALSAHTVGIAETLVATAVALGVLAAGLVLVAVDFDAGHVALAALTSAVAAAGTCVAALRRSEGLTVAAFGASLGVLVETLMFDLPKLGDTALAGSSVLLASAGLLAAGIALRVLWQTQAPLGIASAGAATIALGAALVGVGALVPDPNADGVPDWAYFGIGVAIVAAVYVVLAAATLRVPRLRNLATTLWALGLVALLVSELTLIGDEQWFAVAVAITASVLAALASRLNEQRLWLAGAGLLAADALLVLLSTAPPNRILDVSPNPAEGVIAVVAVAAAGVVLALTAPHSRRWILGAAAVLDLYAVTLITLELAVRVSGAALETDFERGHTAASAVWALTGLGLLVAGVARRSPVLRYAGLALFGVTLAKIFLYDLAELSSVARAASFLAVGGLLLAGGFLVQRLSGERDPSPAPH